MLGDSISHYRIIAQLGAGGMGIVYRAYDEQLQREVAIKVLPPGSLASDDARKNFRKEALALACLNHPNIATIFEFDTRDGRDFLVTEYIPGTTLSDKLIAGPLDSSDIVRLGIQLARGLNAAHAQGLIHRDLKPANLRVTPDGRLKILDFGLAQAVTRLSDMGMTATLTHTQQLAGTLLYMAPEQLRGFLPDKRSDLWAAGAVLYEMATAKNPFANGPAAIVVDSILNETPVAASKRNPKVPSGLQHIIKKCLEKDPARRYQSALELQTDLERIATGQAPARRKSLGPLSFAVAVALMLAAVMIIFYLARARTVHAPESSLPHRRAVAVLGFRNLGGDQGQGWLSTALSEMLTTEIAAGDQLRTIPGENVTRAKLDIKLPEAEALAPTTLEELNHILGADVVVLGSYLDISGQLRVDVRVEGTSSNILAEFSETGMQSQLFDLIQRLGTAIRAKCGVAGITAEEASAVRVSLPENPEAAKLYSDGLDRLRTYDAITARDLLSRAISIDPYFALAHQALAEAWSQLGYDEHAKQESKRAYDLSSHLPHPEAVLIEARYREDSHEWDKAIEIYRSLWTVFPDDPEYGLKLARALTSAGKGEQALEVVNRLRQLAAPMRDDPRIDLAEAEAARALSDYRRDVSASEVAVSKAEQRGASGLRAEGLLQQCWALRNLGEPERAKTLGQQAGEILAGIGDLRGQARSLTCVGNVLADQGQPLPAQKMHEQALELARKTGSQKDIAGALINVGNDYFSQQKLNDAVRQYKEAIALAIQIGDKADALLAQDNLGDVSEMQGDFKAARGFYDASVHTAEDIGDEAGIADALINRAQVSYLQGNLAAAIKDLQEAIAKTTRLQLKTRLAAALFTLGDVQLAQDDLAGAQSSYEKSLEIRKKLNEQGGSASTQVALAILALEKRDATQALTLATQAAHVFETEHDSDQQMYADDALARALIFQAKYSDAASAISSAKKLQVRDLPLTLQLDITHAELLLKTGSPEEAARHLGETEVRANNAALPEIAWRARLVLAEVQIAGGKLAAAQANLKSIERDAGTKGYRLLARKAFDLGLVHNGHATTAVSEH
jgi:tetratricopeptide (TPR) repeat protein/TolB-like protein